MTTTNTYLQGQKAFLDGDMEESIKAFSETLEPGLHSIHSHLNRGIAYFKIGQFFRAIEDFDSILNTDNSHARALLYRGLAFYALGHRAKAEKDIHNSRVLNNVELGEFIEENVLSETLFASTLKFFEKDDANWNLSLTESEVQRMAIVH